MTRIFAAITAALIILAATAASSTRVEAGSRGCRTGAGNAFGTSGTYGYGRYGRYDFGYCAGYGYGDRPAYVPPPYYEQEPAYDGYPVPRHDFNLNFYYDYPAYRRIDYDRPICCRPY
jgi:hypothetical protein